MPAISPNRYAIRYDGARRRLWILGQRCHHGAAGALLTGVAGSWLAGKRLTAPGRASLAGARAAVIAGLGGVMMLHDRRDHAFWFEAGAGTQP